jgi:two-component system LytT family sensor kinase
LQRSRKTIQTIKITFNVIFILVIFFQLLESAYFSIPDDWLFFFTSDAIEHLLLASSTYLLYRSSLTLKSVWKKIGLVSLLLVPLLLLASLKDFRIHNATTFEQTFEYFTSFLGQGLLFYALIYFFNQLEFFNSYKKLGKELNQAKAQLLRNQLHPHFLFNAFNSLYSLSLKNHPDTSDYILKLSSMMRYLTDETHLDKVPLTKELDFIQQYIDIEKMRFGADAPIQLTTNGNINDGQLIAPFLLITLVENAFKHGFYTNAKDAFVRMDLSLANNELLFAVENSVFAKQHFQENNRTGKGLDNLRQRLHLRYPKNSWLKIDSSKNRYRAQLKITLN